MYKQEENNLTSQQTFQIYQIISKKNIKEKLLKKKKNSATMVSQTSNYNPILGDGLVYQTTIS